MSPIIHQSPPRCLNIHTVSFLVLLPLYTVGKKRKKKIHIHQQHQRELPVSQHEGVLSCACLRCHYPGRIKIMFTQLQPQTKRTFTSPLDHESWRNVQPAPCDTALCSPTDSASLCKHRRQAWPCNPALLCWGHLQPPRSPK